tara:strand:+ start:252 stop:542 length:291 start_codon:yes stop_codon:yes gene_type:complete
MTEKPDPQLLDNPITIGEGDPRMPSYTESEIAHQEMMRDPKYAIATHEQTLNKFAAIIEELSARVIAIEQKMLEMQTPDPNDPMKDYPEIQMHQNR